MFLPAIVLTLILMPRQVTSVEDTGEFHPKTKPELHVARTTTPIRIDGDLEDEGWRSAARVGGFTEVEPREQARPLVETEVLVTYDESRLYVAFVAHDDPGAVRASLQKRDEIWTDDWVGIMLDTFGDAAQAYFLLVNPLGVQADLLNSGTGEDPGFDVVFESAGRITDSGYVVEMAIPFSSIRFPNRDEQEWRVTFVRNHPRDVRRIYSWAAVTRNDPCLLCQLGTLYGVHGIEASRSVEILPAIVGSQSGALTDAADPRAGFDVQRIRPEASLNLRYDPSSSVTVEAAFNPDFSQVESDAARIDVNSPFALFYPERRPFFQEGGDLIDTWLNVVYTRSINSPPVALKLTGRTGRTAFAVISALDEQTPLLLPFEERSSLVRAGRSVSNVMRVRRSFATNSFFGGVFTDRRLYDGGYGTLASTDFQWQFLGHHRVQAQLALSSTQEPSRDDVSDQIGVERFDRDRRTGALDGERFGGHAMLVGVHRQTRYWNVGVQGTSVSPTFRAANGFVTRNDYRSLEAYQYANLYPRAKWVERVTPRTSYEHQINFAGETKRQAFAANVFLSMTGQTWANVGYERRGERFAGVDFPLLEGWRVNVGSNFSAVLGGGFYMMFGDDVARFSHPPERGRSFAAGVNLNVRPLTRLRIQPSINHASLRDRQTDAYFFQGYVLRVHTSLQIARPLSLRLITQYNDFSSRFELEPLLTYQPGPFTIFYVGSTHDLESFDAYGWAETKRQFFFKMQYLFRP